MFEGAVHKIRDAQGGSGVLAKMSKNCSCGQGVIRAALRDKGLTSLDTEH